ncbi:MAG: exodeoxyribonuclease VII large subunit, partial [Caulobacteraceae bacterium]
QRLDDAGRRMANCLRKAVDDRARRLETLDAGRRMASCMTKGMEDRARRVDSLDKLRLSLDPKRPLRLGFALVTRPDGTLVHHGGGLAPGEAVSLMFEDTTRQAVIDGEGGAVAAQPVAAKPSPKKATPTSTQQGDLF